MKTAIQIQLDQRAKRQAITSAIYNAKGKFFTVGFIKKDGHNTDSA